MPLYDYPYVIADDFPGGVLAYSDKLAEEIRASAIVTALDHIDAAGGIATVWFKAELSVEDEATLEAVIAAHDDVPLEGEPQAVVLDPKIGGLDTLMDGGALELAPDSWGVIEHTLPIAQHMTSAHVSWCNWQPGDYGFTVLANLAAKGALVAQAEIGETELDIGSALLAAQYDPAVIGSQVVVELWQDTGGGVRGALLERRFVQSVAGSVLTLSAPLSKQHAAGVITVPTYGFFTIPRGEAMIEGGVYLCGSGTGLLGSVMRQEATELLAAGLTLAARVKTTAASGSRQIAITFMLRGAAAQPV